MKFAKCMYSKFRNSKVPDLKLKKGDVFAVTPEIEKEKFYQDGVNTKNFIVVELTTTTELAKVVNVTHAMKKAFNKRLVEADKARKEAAEKAAEAAKPKSHPAPVDKGIKPKAPETESTPEPETQPDEENTEETPKEEVPEDKGDDEKEEEPPISFTELAGNQDKAMEAIAKEIDIEKLELALKLDERKKVQAALKSRIEELKVGE